MSSFEYRMAYFSLRGLSEHDAHELTPPAGEGWELAHFAPVTGFGAVLVAVCWRRPRVAPGALRPWRPGSG